MWSGSTPDMDFNRSIIPLVRFSRFFGLAPYSIRPSRGGVVSYAYCRSAAVYSAARCIGLILLVNMWQGDILKDTVVGNSGVIQVAYYLRSILGFASFVYSSLACFVNRDEILNVFKEISNICVALDVNGYTLKRYRCLIILQLALLVVMVTLQLLIGAIVYKLSFWKTHFILVVFLVEVAKIVPELQFNSLLIILGQLIKELQEKLSNLDGDSSENDIKKKNEGKAERWLTRSSRLNVSLSTWKAPVESLHASDVHGSLCDVIDKVNGLYGFQNLLSISNVAIDLLYCTYTCIDSRVFLAMSSQSVNIITLYASMGVSLLCSVVRLLFTVGSCCSAMTQAQELTHTVSRLHNSARNTRFRQQMQALSLQMLHHKVQFSACGLFPIDATLTTTVVGCVCTYLVILMQFIKTPGNTAMTTTSPSL